MWPAGQNEHLCRQELRQKYQAYIKTYLAVLSNYILIYIFASSYCPANRLLLRIGTHQVNITALLL